MVAQQLHRENIERVVQEALERSGVLPSQLSAVATTVKPGLGLSLGIGLEFSQRFVRMHNKPFIPIHHMEAHALTVRMLQPVAFPFLVLLISGGHSLLAVARGVDDFLLLGRTLDEAPGDTLDKVSLAVAAVHDARVCDHELNRYCFCVDSQVARRLSLIKHPQCSTLSGGQALELLAKDGDRARFPFRTPMGQTYDCCFSFAGLRNQITMTIKKKEAEEGMRTAITHEPVIHNKQIDPVNSCAEHLLIFKLIDVKSLLPDISYTSRGIMWRET